MAVTQDEINAREWRNPDNWGNPKWLGVYFSKRDTRIVVPKRKRWTGWTFNFARPAGILIFIGLFILAILTQTVAHALA